MKHIKLFLMIMIYILSWFSLNASAETENYDSYILKYKGIDTVQIITEDEKNFLLNANMMLNDMYDEKPEIEYIEPNYEVFLFNDDTVNKNWNVDMVKAQTAWNYGCYGNDVKIAVIDSGIYGGACAENCVVEGYNFIDKSNDTTDNIGHGTFVSSIICGKTADEYAKGISPKIKLIPIKCFDTGCSTKVDIIADAIEYAVNVCDCDIINMSFGLKSNSSYLKKQIDNALNKGVILIAAVGNNGNSSVRYPAAYDGVVGVGAIDKNLNYCSFSQFNNSVDVVAPGKEIYGFSIEGFTANSGTSFSAPHITAAAAIAKSITPNLTPDEFDTLLQQTSYDLGTEGYDVYYGYGLLDVEKLSLKLINDYDVFMSPINIENNKAWVSISNNGKKSISAINIFSVFDDNKYVGCNITDIKLTAGEKINIYNDVFENSMEYFVWDGLNNLKPLCPSRTLNFEDIE